MIASHMSQTTVDHATFTLMFQRTFSASREDVFDAWTQPDQLAQWWDPGGTPLSECTIDLRPGGAFRFVNAGSASSHPFSGVYRAVERPALLVFEALGALGTVKLESLEGRTHMTLSIRCASAEHLEQFLKAGIDVGTARTLDNLVAHVS